jgi:hypothetical protein
MFIFDFLSVLSIYYNSKEKKIPGAFKLNLVPFGTLILWRNIGK